MAEQGGPPRAGEFVRVWSTPAPLIGCVVGQQDSNSIGVTVVLLDVAYILSDHLTIHELASIKERSFGPVITGEVRCVSARTGGGLVVRMFPQGRLKRVTGTFERFTPHRFMLLPISTPRVQSDTVLRGGPELPARVRRPRCTRCATSPMRCAEAAHPCTTS